jgi:hypothetical protein
MSALNTAALGMKTGNPELDAFLAREVPHLVRQGFALFAGKDADQRLAQARAYIDAILPIASQQATEQLGKEIACGDRCPACCVYCERTELLPIETHRLLDLVERQGRLEEVLRRAELWRARGKGACPLLSTAHFQSGSVQPVDLVRALPAAAAARLRQAKKRQRRAARVQR